MNKLKHYTYLMFRLDDNLYDFESPHFDPVPLKISRCTIPTLAGNAENSYVYEVFVTFEDDEQRKVICTVSAD